MSRFFKGVVAGVLGVGVVAGAVCGIGYGTRDTTTGEWFGGLRCDIPITNSNNVAVAYVDGVGYSCAVDTALPLSAESSVTQVPVLSLSNVTAISADGSAELHGREYMDMYVSGDLSFSYSVGYFVSICPYLLNGVYFDIFSSFIEANDCLFELGMWKTSTGYQRDITIGKYSASMSPLVSSEVDAEAIYYSYYFTFTDKTCFCSYAPTFGVGDINDYDDSLNNILFSFDKGSRMYGTFLQFLFSDNATAHISVAFDNADDAGNFIEFKVVERFQLEKDMEIPTKEGYTFTGWYFDEACTQKYNGETITADTSLYAGFEINKYTVTYNAGYTSNDPNEAGLYDRVETVEHGQAANYIPTVEGSTFLGWYLEDGTKYENTSITRDTVLLGQWKLDEYTVTLDLNGGVADGEIVFMVERGSVPIFPTVTREGYEFTGWLDITDESVSGQQYELSAVMADLKLRATWKRNVFTVTFYVDGEIFKQINVEYGKTLYEVSAVVGVDSQNIVSYCNENKDTAAVAFNKFTVEDDISVYLDGVELKDGVDSTISGIKGFFAKVKNFFNSVGQFFADYWIYLISGVAVIAVVGGVVAIIVKRRR